jgi:hypothetical protein
MSTGSHENSRVPRSVQELLEQLREPLLER